MNEKMKSILVVAILLLAGLLFLLCLPTGNVAGATTRFVGATGSTYATIQDAIDDAQEQDMIVIEDGTYTEKLDFSTITAGPLTELIIMGKGSVTIDGSGGTDLDKRWNQCDNHSECGNNRYNKCEHRHPADR
jgi:pectin methylesterase-like acyl-CoA thioesterase